MAPRGSNGPRAITDPYRYVVHTPAPLPRVHHRTPYTTAPLYTRRLACSVDENSALGSMALIPFGPWVPGVSLPGYCSRIFGQYGPVARASPR